MAVQITDKFQYFKDLDGDPLNNGYVYIGTSGFNAEVSQISIYSDSSLTIPIAQPIRTIGGYLVNNGSPINIYVPGDYSIMVKDSDETLVYSSLSDNLSEASNAALDAVAAKELAEQAVIDAGTEATAAAEAVLTSKYDSSNIVEGGIVPTIANLSNMASSNIPKLRYQRIGNTVNCRFEVQITPTSATTTSFYIYVPIEGSISTVAECFGTMNNSSKNIAGVVYGSATPDKVIANFVAVDTSVYTLRGVFAYELS